MLMLTVLGSEYFNEETEEFLTMGDVTLELEHSLVSLSKWEGIWNKPFLSSVVKTDDEIRSYIECMTLSPNFSPELLNRFSAKNYKEIEDLINASMTATWFGETKDAPSREVVTAEVIYYWMLTLNIPFDRENWHLDRLLTLIRVVSQKNAPQKKMSPGELAARNRALNEERLKQLKTTG